MDLTYNGSGYHGWQKQPNVLSVQEIVESRLSTALQETIGVMGAGRTDTGVHAKQLIVHFDYSSAIDEKQLAFKLNTMLPKDIAVNEIYAVTQKAHARFDALSREYHYYVATKKDPFIEGFSYYIKKKIDVEVMNQAAKRLLGRHDFKCFSKVKTEVKTYYCTIEHAFWKEKGDRLVFSIKADRFLRNMVRAIVGTLLDLGVQKITMKEFEEILSSRNRSRAGKSVDAKGLFLTKIEYPKEIIEK